MKSLTLSMKSEKNHGRGRGYKYDTIPHKAGWQTHTCILSSEWYDFLSLCNFNIMEK